MSEQPLDLKAEVRRAFSAEGGAAVSHSSSTLTSDLSIDEELNLHAIGWEPVELVSGVSLYSAPAGMWNWGQGEITGASDAHNHAFAHAIDRIHQDAAFAGGHGVVGVHVERQVYSTHIEVSLIGTAVRPVGSGKVDPNAIFVSDLSARDFTLLMVAGWEPLGLANGASFVYAPRRTMGAALQQQSQNIELTNYTAAMYSAREAAMERMQKSAIGMKGSGVVEVKFTEGPMSFASHAVGFAAWGTVVRLKKEAHQFVQPIAVVSLNDAAVAFDAETLA
ncbi:MAG TPA: heavy metal-binding domain-containing protein [Acidimicrobiales bacterium]|nr:heavy metal-binding domain-containing protein [Acidimicrobiales bacterium]